jgi:nucleotide-binding universal stress UspA family protein
LLELAEAEGLEPAEARVIAGNRAARELQRVTEEPDTGLMVIGSTTRGAVGRLLIGGIAERLLTGAGCPVAGAPSGYAERPAPGRPRIGVGLDGSEEARRALDAAVSLARPSGAEIRVITVFQRLAFGAGTTTALPGPSANDVMHDELHAMHDAAVDGIPQGIPTQSRFLRGTADDILLAESEDLDLLVVGSRGYGPLGAVLLGSASTALARGASCPLLVMARGTDFDLLA